MTESKYRALPSVDKVLGQPAVEALLESYPHELVVSLARQRLDNARDLLGAGKKAPTLDEVADAVVRQAEGLATPGPHPVLNASGVILHTNLGRAPLSPATLEAMAGASLGYADLEVDLSSGSRGSRNVHIESLLCQLTGAEAALVVNNNAAAVLLGLTALAKRREVIVSRGQAVEIGGGFRVPEVMRQSGSKLIDVGTTNRTYIADYAAAVSVRTGALLRVHTSNFTVVGFTNQVPLEELVALGQERGVPVFDDLGSGCLLDTTAYGLAYEPTVQESVAAGVGLAFFSGDKLVGGPQAGIVVGRREYIDKLKKHPLARALRIDKTRLAGLSATLIHYLKGEAVEQVPVWRMISTPADGLEYRASLWAQALGGYAEVVAGESMVGGGSLPGDGLPTYLVALPRLGRHTAQTVARRLRGLPVPIIARISEDAVLLDPRTVLPEADPLMVKSLYRLAAELK